VKNYYDFSVVYNQASSDAGSAIIENHQSLPLDRVINFNTIDSTQKVVDVPPDFLTPKTTI